MMTKHMTVTLRLDAETRRRLEKAAGVQGQSLATFVEGAAEELARRVLLAWAVDRYIEGDRSFGELAEETGLSIEEIMGAMETIGDRERVAALAALWGHKADEATDMLLTSARSLARLTGDLEFLRRAERVAAEGRAADRGTGDAAQS